MRAIGYVVVESLPVGQRNLDHAVLHPSPQQALFWAGVRTREAGKGELYTVHAVDAEQFTLSVIDGGNPVTTEES